MWTTSLVTASGETNLSDNTNYLLTGLSGIGMAPTRRITQQGPEQHGATDLGYRLQERKIALSLLALGGSEDDWFTRRNTVLSLFRPADAAVSLKIATSDGTIVRQIDCYFSAHLDLGVDPDLRQGWQPVAVELVAPDPTWYDPVGVSVTYGIGGAGQAMNVPLAVPWPVGTSSINTARALSYAGTWDAYPTITVVGPITNPVITNDSLGDKLDFTGLALAAGQKRVIDCRYGYKTVVDQSGTNKVSDLTSDSNLATFRVGAHPNPLNGGNSIRVSGTNITTATEVYLQYNTRYVGV